MKIHFAKFGAILGALGIALGAFGAHSLKESLKLAGNFDTFETAVRYQFYNAFALIVLSLIAERTNNKFTNWSGNLFIIGSVIFSGSLYLICFTGIKTFGAIAPIGGLCLIAAWLCMFISIKTPKD
jgi:uncharacterized membrane protein YgdD (TMEM256/DUF423 family)